jgi:hypothetical protein
VFPVEVFLEEVFPVAVGQETGGTQRWSGRGGKAVNFSDPTGIEIRPPVKLLRVTSNCNKEGVLHNYTVVTTIPYNPGISIYLIRQAVTSMH